MRTRHEGLLVMFSAVTLFSFWCLFVSRITQTSNQLINCRNHILEFKETILHLRNKTERNRQELMEVLDKLKDDSRQRRNVSVNFVGKKVSILDKNETILNAFEDLKFFFPHLRNIGKIYPNVIISKGKTGDSNFLKAEMKYVTKTNGGLDYCFYDHTTHPDIERGDHSYLKQTLTSLFSRMTLAEQQDSVVIVCIADSNENYLNYVVDMITKKFKRQLKSGSLEVISIPAFFYPDTSHAKQSTKESQKWKRWYIKQSLDFCFLMLYAKPKAAYYLQLEDDIIAKQMYFTKITDFVHSITSKNWFYIEFSILGFIGKLFKSEDLTDFVRFFLIFHKDKPIDLLLKDIFWVKVCEPGETNERCAERNEQIRFRYKPSLFQHVGIQSSLHGKKQYLKNHFLEKVAQQGLDSFSTFFIVDKRLHHIF